MAKELGIPSTLEESLEVVVNGVEKSIDLIGINGTEHCLHLSDIGMNAQLVKYFEEGKMRGKLGYARGVLRVLMRRRLLRIQVNTGNEVVHRAAFMVVLANARMLGASSRQLLRHVYLPSATSWVFSSLHTSVGLAFVGAVVGEYLGSSQGVGYLILQAEGSFDINTVMAGIVVLTAFALVLDAAVGRLEKRLMKWQPRSGETEKL